MEIRNIAIIAHVDHGKTTLVDKILHATKVFRDNQETGELIMDSNDLEKERGITIFSKNASVMYKGVKINVIDTPGHADFGGEVERVLKMADGVLLLVDAFEGPMQMQITSLDYSSFLGRIAVGKVARGTVREGQPIALMQADGSIRKSKVKELYVFESLGKKKATDVHCGDICAVVGLEDFNIGDTIADQDNPEALPLISVDEPTMSMMFSKIGRASCRERV